MVQFDFVVTECKICANGKTIERWSRKADLNEDKAASTAHASSVAEKIRSTLAEPYLLAVEHSASAGTLAEHRCTASLGVVVFIDREGTQDDFLRLADKAMYQAKNAGSNLIRFFEVGG